VPAKINADISIPHMNILYIANNEAYSEKILQNTTRQFWYAKSYVEKMFEIQKYLQNQKNPKAIILLTNIFRWTKIKK
jgi:hypothetical protein